LFSCLSTAGPMSTLSVGGIATPSRPLISTTTKILWKYYYTAVLIYPVCLSPFPKTFPFLLVYPSCNQVHPPPKLLFTNPLAIMAFFSRNRTDILIWLSQAISWAPTFHSFYYNKRKLLSKVLIYPVGGK
jgi:hypothetical protein